MIKVLSAIFVLCLVTCISGQQKPDDSQNVVIQNIPNDSKDGILKVAKFPLFNPSEKPMLVTKIGAKLSYLTLGRDLCSTRWDYGLDAHFKQYAPTESETDYNIPIEVRSQKDKEVIIEVDRVAVIEPGKLHTIRLSVIPNTSFMQACYEDWSFSIEVFLIYQRTSDQKEIRVNFPYLLVYNKENFLQSTKSKINEEVKKALRHADWRTRVYGVRNLLPLYRLEDDLSVVKEILRDKLENDPNEEVKGAAAYVAGELKIKELGNTLLEQLSKVKSPKVAKLFCSAFVRLEYKQAAPELFNLMFSDSMSFLQSNYNGYDDEYPDYPWDSQYNPARALVDMRLPLSEVSQTAVKLFQRYRNSKKQNSSAKLRTSVANLCWLVIQYEDVSSIPYLTEIANETDFSHLNQAEEEVWEGLLYLNGRSDDQLLNNNFIIGMRAVFERIFNFRNEHQSGSSNQNLQGLLQPSTIKEADDSKKIFDITKEFRPDIFSILCRMPQEENERRTLILMGFQDKELKVRLEAARMAALFKFREFISNITVLRKKFTNDQQEGVLLCSYLNELGQPCEE